MFFVGFYQKWNTYKNKVSDFAFVVKPNSRWCYQCVKTLSEMSKLFSWYCQIAIGVKITEDIINIGSLRECSSRNSSQILDDVCEFKFGQSSIRVVIILVKQFHEETFSAYFVCTGGLFSINCFDFDFAFIHFGVNKYKLCFDFKKCWNSF